MEQSQIIRLPKKYGELFSTLSNEEAGKLIKEIFGFDSGIEGMTRIYRDIINVDINNMESSAINGLKGGRPKKEKPQDITPGYGNKKPQVIENDNLKVGKGIEDKIKEDKNKEKKETIKNELIEYSKIETNVSSILVKCFLELGWNPPKEETIETIKNWMKEVFYENGIEDTNEMKLVLDRWYEYWKEQKRPKNIKSTFRNTIKFSK